MPALMRILSRFKCTFCAVDGFHHWDCDPSNWRRTDFKACSILTFAEWLVVVEAVL